MTWAFLSFLCRASTIFVLPLESFMLLYCMGIISQGTTLGSNKLYHAPCTEDKVIARVALRGLVHACIGFLKWQDNDPRKSNLFHEECNKGDDAK